MIATALKRQNTPLMKNLLIPLFASLTVAVAIGYAQTIDLARAKFEASNVSVSMDSVAGKSAVRVTKDPKLEAVDEATFAKLVGSDFKNGTIEVKVLSRLLPNAPDHARGFIGVAFRIDPSNSRFEAIYIRPTNGRAEDQVRRNRATQYFSYPDFKFDRLRKEAPGQFESYADMTLNEWITLKIEVNGSTAKLFLNGGAQPVLVVNDLKHGPESSGAIGLWVDVGTEGYFSDLAIVRH